ncbi:MAG TPA: SCE4755 family polysaccharide monooxygenase-like protein [Kofleriaceae bacterium]|nr:SCE4755 family polysaccharide monooxygenase-like protein [Kofleriaceae bacterium]
MAPKLPVVLACLAAASPAYAHFVLMQPASWTKLDGGGNPQKSPPCGNEGSPVANGPVIEYKAGDTIPITIEETTFHPGHYRVSIAKDQASLPDDPDGDVVGASCGSLAINKNPTLPLVADGVLVHTNAFGATNPQAAMVKLPAGMTCDSCVLQVVEFMSSHGAPCFYHHCSNIKITVTGADAGIPGSGGGGNNNDAGVDGDPNMGGCCGASGGSSSALLGLMVAAGVLLRRGRARGRAR